MGYNEDIEGRIDRLLDRIATITKKRMFGGIGYLFQGNMCFGIHKKSLLLRVSPQKSEELMRSEYVTPFDITGKPMKGWVLISPDILETEEQLLETLMLGFNFAKTLPKK
jgi:TfoX/Sxy family transcriptional regulator of competence genes